MVRKHVGQEEPARKGCIPPVAQCAYAISSEPLRLSRDTIHGNGVRIRIRNDEKHPPWMHPRQAAHRLSGHALLSMFIYALIPMARRNAWRYPAGYVKVVRNIAYFADFARKSTALARKSSLPEAHISDRFCHIGKKYYLCSPCNIGKSQQN